MKRIITFCFVLITASALAQQKPQKKQPPKVIFVKKAPPVVIPDAKVRRSTPGKFRNKPVPKVVIQKVSAPKKKN